MKGGYDVKHFAHNFCTLDKECPSFVSSVTILSEMQRVKKWDELAGKGDNC